ncbi:dirigent protein 19-like [Argentina anserina]|uniref:dirigent protein 19-like n=1 Tax=Argentina anserina TaxID=57926 RepID=UPI0021762774|nr:dirigent protein 19-like [Potentilla anserina]
MSDSIIKEIEEIDHWYQKLHHSKPKLTKLQFYFHDTISGPAKTTVTVVPPPEPSTTLFGQINMFDDPLTMGPEPTSKLLGRAQGLYAFASHDEISLLMAVTFVLTSGKHNGSSFTILGRNAVEHSTRDFPIVGGTGHFRLARGFAIAQTYLVNASVAIVEYNVAIMHY